MRVSVPLLAACLGLGIGCSDGAADEGPSGDRLLECDQAGDVQTVVVQSLTFVRQTDGVSDGFDLDAVQSALNGPTGCGIADLVGPDGATGIDNAFSYLLPVLELTEAAAVESLVQQAIDDGRLMISLDLSEVDDPTNDACVDLTIGRAAGEPMHGTDGRLLSGQTLDRDLEAPTYVAEDLVLENGVIDAPLELTLPVTIFDLELEFALQSGRIRATLGDDGTWTGIFAGGVDIAYLLEIAADQDVDADLRDLLGSLLYAWADLAPGEDGGCTQVSMGFSFQAIPVFYFTE